MRIILATPSFRILSVASIVLISSVSGSTIVLMLFFALSLSKSTNPMIKWLLSLFRSSDRVSVQNMTSQLGSLYPQFWRFSSSCPSDSSKEWYFLKCNFIISAHTLLLFQNDFRFFFIIFLSDGTISVNSLRTGRCFFESNRNYCRIQSFPQRAQISD